MGKKRKDQKRETRHRRTKRQAIKAISIVRTGAKRHVGNGNRGEKGREGYEESFLLTSIDTKPCPASKRERFVLIFLFRLPLGGVSSEKFSYQRFCRNRTLARHCFAPRSFDGVQVFVREVDASCSLLLRFRCNDAALKGLQSR